MDLRPVSSIIAWALVLLAFAVMAAPSLAGPTRAASVVPANAGLGLEGPNRTGANDVIASLQVGKNPLPPVYDAANGDVYVANYDMTNISVISGTANAVVATITVPAQPITPTLDSANGDLYVATQVSDSVSVISGTTNTVNATIPLGTNVESLPPVYDSWNGDLYVASAFSNTVAVISTTTNTVITNISVPGFPLVPTYDDGNGNMYIAIEGTGIVSVIAEATNTVTANVSVGPQYLQTGVYDDANGNLYFPEIPAGSSGPLGSVAVISGSTNEVVGTIAVGQLPETPVVDTGNGELYVANYGTNNVSVISGATNAVVGTVPTGEGPNPPTYDSGNGDLYVSCELSNNVTVISGATHTVVANVPVGGTPEVGSYDPATGSLFLSNKASNNVSELADGSATMYPATLTETGLPAGTKWSVTMAGVVRNSTEDSISFLLPNGSYAYSVATARCAATAPTGAVTILAAAASVSVPFPSGKCGGTAALTELQYAEIGGLIAGAFVVGGLVATGRLFRRTSGGKGGSESTASPPASEASPVGDEGRVAGATSQFRKARRRRQLRWSVVTVVVALLLISAYLIAIPPTTPSKSGTGSTLSGFAVHLGNVSVGVVTCGTGTAVVTERVPWINATRPVTTAQIVMLVVDIDGDILSDTGSQPQVNASSSCAGAPPTPRQGTGLGNDFSWYVVLSDPSGANVAFFSVSQGWVPVSSGSPSPLTVANGSALTLICTPSVSRLGPYNFEGTYELKVGIIVSGSSGILAAVPL